MITVKFKKLNFAAIRPTKRDCDAGYDIYGIPSVSEETLGFYSFQPGEVVMIPTGIATAIPEGYVAIVKERGSTGSKGLAVRCGVIDSGYRGEWFIAIQNTTEKSINYPVEKAIAQVVFVKAETVCFEDDELDESERGDGKLGSSGK